MIIPGHSLEWSLQLAQKGRQVTLAGTKKVTLQQNKKKTNISGHIIRQEWIKLEILEGMEEGKRGGGKTKTTSRCGRRKGNMNILSERHSADMRGEPR